MNLFIIEKIENSILYLGEEETHHLSKVLRIQQNEKVYATDGRGTLWIAEVKIISKKNSSLVPISYEIGYKKSDFHLHLAVAFPKNTERVEWLLEKAVEIGVDEITPILSNRSERKRINMPRANKIITSAIKQSFRAYIPNLNEPISFEEFLFNEEKDPKRKEKFIAHCNEDFEKKSLKELFFWSQKKALKYTLLIGPEGDFSKQEICKAMNLDYKGVSLSNFRLRVETAALIGLHHIHLSLN